MTRPNVVQKVGPSRNAEASHTPVRVNKTANGIKKSVRELCAELSPAIIQRMADIALDPQTAIKEAIQAGSVVLSYGVSKPAPEVATTGATGQLSLVKRLLTGAGPPGDVDGSGAAVTAAEDVMLDPATTGQGVITGDE